MKFSLIAVSIGLALAWWLCSMIANAQFSTIPAPFSSPSPTPSTLEVPVPTGAVLTGTKLTWGGEPKNVWLVWADSDGEVHFYKLKKGTVITEP